MTCPFACTLELNYRNHANTGVPPVWSMEKVRIYVPGTDGVIGAREFDPVKPAGQQETPLVYHYDHLGTIDAVTRFGSADGTYATDSDGKPSRFSEDAWGERRNPDTWSGPPTTSYDDGPNSVTPPRGFTGHEMLDDLGLVHMNGRIYDPLLGRMLSPDVAVQNPQSLQSYNRYTYVDNSPLTMTDPSGFVATPVEVAGGGIIVVGGVAIMAATPQGRQAAADLSHTVVQIAHQQNMAPGQKAELTMMVTMMKLISFFHSGPAHVNQNAIATPSAGTGQLQNTQTSDMTATGGSTAATTASPAPAVTTPQEGMSQAASDVAATEGMSTTQGVLPNTTGTAVPDAQLPIAVDATNDQRRTTDGGRMTEPNLPARTIVSQGGVTIEHYVRSGDHALAHLHVYGQGSATKIGQAGKLIEGSPELSATQREVIEDNKSAIRKAVDQIQRWFRFNNHDSVDRAVYDWAIERGSFTPKKPEHGKPRFIASFSSAAEEHFHYEDGIRLGG